MHAGHAPRCCTTMLRTYSIFKASRAKARLTAVPTSSPNLWATNDKHTWRSPCRSQRIKRRRHAVCPTAHTVASLSARTHADTHACMHRRHQTPRPTTRTATAVAAVYPRASGEDEHANNNSNNSFSRHQFPSST